MLLCRRRYIRSVFRTATVRGKCWLTALLPLLRRVAPLRGTRPVSLLRRARSLLPAFRPVIYTYYIVVVIGATCHSSQFSRIFMVKSCCAARTSAGYSLCGVLLSVSIGINHPCRPGILRLCNSGPEYINGVILHPYSTGPAGIADVIYLWALMGITLNIGGSWPCYISAPTINISIINDSSVTYNGNCPGMRHIIAVYIRAIDIGLRCKDPIIIRHTVTAAERQADTYPRH